MTTPEERYKALLETANTQYGLVVEDKTTRWYWRWIGKLLTLLSLGNLDFMGSFNTTLGNRVGTVPGWESQSAGYKYYTLLHEVEHMRQYKAAGFGNLWLGFVISGFAYIFLPFPVGVAYVRARMEMGGYAQSIRAVVQLAGPTAAASMKPLIVNHFMGIDYFFMWPFRQYMNTWFDNTLAAIVAEEDECATKTP